MIVYETDRKNKSARLAVRHRGDREAAKRAANLANRFGGRLLDHARTLAEGPSRLLSAGNGNVSHLEYRVSITETHRLVKSDRTQVVDSDFQLDLVAA